MAWDKSTLEITCGASQKDKYLRKSTFNSHFRPARGKICPMSETFETPDQYIENLVDTDPSETNEWIQSLDATLKNAGPVRAKYLLGSLLKHAHENNVPIGSIRNTDYINTIAPEREPQFPGDEHIERRIRAAIRWNAAMMVHRAQRPGVGVGGHISTYASSAALYEVGFNHFFRGQDHPGGGDQIFFQGHASPGMYARAFVEGRLSEDQLDGFRQELSHEGGGLSSYPHPRLMPNFWQFPTVSMGLGPINAIYQARFNRYLHNRGIKDTSQQHVWAFLGDGETDEVESLGALSLASREGLDNLTFVINCNLQRLDGPVRGNGKIIQELESIFGGAGWNVIKVIWGRGWDELLAKDKEGALVQLMNATPDGDYQTFKTEDGKFVREIVPTQLFRALNGDTKLLKHLQGCKAVLVGGAAIDDSLLALAKAQGINCVTTYGMTETSGGCVYNGEPLPGVEIKIEETIQIKGPMLARVATQDGFFVTQDLGFIEDGKLFVTGRADDVIISGGKNISLSAVERLFGIPKQVSGDEHIGIVSEEHLQAFLDQHHPIPLQRVVGHG